MKDINRKLPKKRYNDEMKENDEYETLKDTMRLGGFLKGVNLFNNNYGNNDNDNNNNNNVKYDKINVINKPIIMNKKKNAIEDLYDKVFNNQNQKNYYNYYNNNNINNKNNNNNNYFGNKNQYENFYDLRERNNILLNNYQNNNNNKNNNNFDFMNKINNII